MRPARRLWISLLALPGALLWTMTTAQAQQRSIPLSELRPGSTFMSPDIKAMQDDSFANPGLLWVEKGEKLWSAPATTVVAGGAQKSCASCHNDARASMKGVSARYPVFDTRSRKLLNLEGRINQCRTERQGAAALPYESEELLALTAYVAHQSRGMPLNVSIAGAAQPHFENGRVLHQRRIGQMNLACIHCHEWNAGKRLLAENISQGHGNGYPAYRLEWQAAGSLHRRLRACYFGVRAEMPQPGSQELLDLELYLGWRAQGLLVETPGVRR
jgi:sulfur-oxidizing protein SoxA